MKSPGGVFVLHKDIYATRVITLSVEELGVTSKANLEGLSLGIGFIRIYNLLPRNQTITGSSMYSQRDVS